MPDKVEVWLDVAFFPEALRVGTLSHDRGQIWFNYHKEWLCQPLAFALDPDLSLDAAPFFPNPEMGNFGVFLDSSPDRWGQTLMKRREMLEAKDAKRPIKNLYAWDFLLGVQDETRQGALRFRRENEAEFISSHTMAAPPVTSLGELQSVAHELTNKRLNDLEGLRRWLAVLVAPGASLGGARPKANFKAQDGSLWIAKFPSRDDELDIGAWEGVAHTLAIQSGIQVPEAKVIHLGKDHHTFCVKRFDRDNHRRVYYASAMTLLRKEQSEGSSYLEIAQFIQMHGIKQHIQSDLEQLFRRVVFNILIANKDDHLRNHGFLLTPHGWTLSPAFDINPNLDKETHVLSIDEYDNRPDLDSALTTSEWYGIKQDNAKAMIQEIQSIVKKWPQIAKRAGIASAEVELMSSVLGH